MSRYWRCRRVTKGVPCGTLNLARKRKCTACGKPKPPPRKKKHMTALEIPYEEYVALNGGEWCGVCGAPRPESRRLDRDHSHTIPPYPRGLLCRKCNRTLVKVRYGLKITPEWLRAAAEYLERAQERV
jgi:hypothetical protein